MYKITIYIYISDKKRLQNNFVIICEMKMDLLITVLRHLSINPTSNIIR